jgi:hypothetical protein
MMDIFFILIISIESNGIEYLEIFFKFTILSLRDLNLIFE